MVNPFTKFRFQASHHREELHLTDGQRAPQEEHPFETMLFAVILLAAALIIQALAMQAFVSTANAQGIARQAAQTSTRKPTLGFKPGEEVVLASCLRFMVRGFTDREGVLDHFDWVNLRVQNDCDNVRRHLLVELVLLDAYGTPYGTPIWVLERGEKLWPGRSKIGNFPIPDPENLTPVRWAVRLMKVERPRSFRRDTGTAPVQQAAPQPTAPRPVVRAPLPKAAPQQPPAGSAPKIRKAEPGGRWWK